MREEIKCGLKVEGIDDSNLRELFEKTHDVFNLPSLKEKTRFVGQGKINIEGIGKDKRCAFCEYLRKLIIDYFKQNNTKGWLELIHCPFNPGKRIDYSPETMKARKDLIDLFFNSKK